MFPLNQCVDAVPPGEAGVTIKPRGIPVISVVTQGLLSNTAVARRPDSDTPEDMFRRYEIPGAAHVNQKSNDNKPCTADIAKAGIPTGAANCEGILEYGVTDFPIEFFMNSAYNNLYARLRKGTPPPRAEPIETEEMTDSDGLLHIKLDEASAFFCMPAGYKAPFGSDKIKGLYPTHGEYLNRVNAMVDKMVEERFLTESDGKRLKASAERSRQ